MRGRKAMIDVGIGFARSCELIRIFTLEGSLTNKNIPTDKFQDYDFSYFVTDIEYFKKSDDWLDYFGKRLMLQKPEAMELFPSELGSWFSYIIIFEDGVKMDLTLIPLHEYEEYFKNSDGLVEVLLDKDNIIQHPVIATDKMYHIQKPSSQSFDDCCNEFWMSATYVTKGLMRRELLVAAEMMNSVCRPQLLTMLRWKVGIETDFSLSVGKSDKFLQKYVSGETWTALVATYKMSSYEDMWEGLYTSFALFRETSHVVSNILNYSYPNYDEKGSKYIEWIRQTDI
ncbi:aminoglycoside 6-adenylyltransferase [Priestia taiwanensis]|uniref:Aminoglycoside 6-adenylyltransferase n=1 Tax=Priestia taiwanensis TaxID=1347902 RepID=A0A917ELZ2_9BACI|nr:aminoglycoside 6-adenylyltransferase [Priestia taiwanensis]MBM7361556.1 aminoglycoside 6-adenylyltransferase [Priestia taiwanensis]GGE55146.1 aminoglycoside 6-adenylyltransferase [Priestia taiwanensis]